MESTFSVWQATGEKRPRGQKSALACNFCRSKKVKCNSDYPCTNCVDHRQECRYSTFKRQRTTGSAKELGSVKELTSLRDRLARVESLLPNPRNQLLSLVDQDEEPTIVVVCPNLGTAVDPNAHPANEMDQTVSEQELCRVQQSGALHLHAQDVPVPVASPPATLTPAMNVPTMLLPTVSRPPVVQFSMNEVNLPSFDLGRLTPSPTDTPNPRDDHESNTFLPEEELHFEYHGPGSFLAICSRSGIEWVAAKTGVTYFGQMAKKLTYDVSAHLKLDSSVEKSKDPEPDEQTAWKLTRLYFEEDPDAVFGIIPRQNFESMLQAHYSRDSQAETSSDMGWYALRNLVFAAGSRVLLIKNSTENSQENFMSSQSWRYFLNSLSAHTDLMFCRTSLLAIQALAAMSFFVEAIGCPSLDYMLCSSAMKLAQSKGLHRQPAATWNLAPSVVSSRSLLWWVIYTFERHNSCRSGRPLAVYDNEISCQLPNEAVGDDRDSGGLLKSLVNHARLSGRITRTITSLKASKPTLETVAHTISSLSTQLEEWWEMVPDYVRDDMELSSPMSRPLPPKVHFYQIIYHHYSYYSSLSAIHSILVHPWNSLALALEPRQTDKLSELVARSTSTFIKATRKTLRSLPHLDVTIASPKWLVFVHPLTALINLFIYVIQYPYEPTAESDIALMYLVTGHFSYLEFVTSDLTFPSVRQLANLARATVSKARERPPQAMAIGLQFDSLRFAGNQMQTDFGSMDEGFLSSMNLENENWATLFRWPEVYELLDEVQP